MMRNFPYVAAFALQKGRFANRLPRPRGDWLRPAPVFRARRLGALSLTRPPLRARGQGPRESRREAHVGRRGSAVARRSAPRAAPLGRPSKSRLTAFQGGAGRAAAPPRSGCAREKPTREGPAVPRRDRHELWQLRRPPRQRRARGGDSGEKGSPGPERVKRAPGASAACVSAAGPGTPAGVLPGQRLPRLQLCGHRRAPIPAPSATRRPAEPRAPPQPEASAAAAGAGPEPRAVAARRGGRAGGGAARVAFPGATSERSTPRRPAASPVARQQVWRRRSPRASGSGRVSFLPASARPGRRGPSGTMPMDVILVVWFCVCTARTVLGSGMDPDLQMDIITELDLVNTTLGVTQVSGLHNASKAFLFQDTHREVHAAPHVSEKLIQLFRNKSDFTFLATVQQKASTSGVILSIRELEHSYFELESSGLRDEIRYHYMHDGKPRTEALPYRLADGQWHRVALSVSASRLLLHVDCNRIYERVIDLPETNLPPGSNLWLGQRNQKHGLFKGIIQDGKIIFMPNGYITQCPNLNRTCPTCSDFLSLVQGIMDLQELLAKMTAKLNYAETRLSQLENCHCEKTCQVSGLLYRDQDSWVDGDHCRNCTCKSGTVECRRMSCPPLTCSPDSLPVHIAGQCCKVCRPKCIYGGKVLAEGQRILTKSCRECRGGVLVKITEACPPLNCSAKDHILPENQCCRVCRGHNFCAEGPKCGENSECKNWNTKATCECKSGYISGQGDSAYCEDIDECAAKMHYCHANTVCVNLPGLYRCDCVPGYIRVDDFSCTEHDECGSGQHNCDENAICTNTVQGHSCTCKPGYVGNGTVCRAFCQEGCRSGGTCVAPNKCLCPSGFTGSHCEKDIDECTEGIIECHHHSRCVNLPGWYHCECRSGFHDDGTYSLSGESCVDIDECALRTHTCWNDSACVNLAGGFDCLCPSGPSCSGDCPHEGELKRNGQVWTLKEDRCSVCSCKDGKVFCRRTACDCQNPSVDLFCCPECDTRVTSQCLDQSGRELYRSGDSWTHGCQQCRCLEGEVDCWPLACPSLSCEYSATLEGECCPRCVSDPCLADNITYDIRKTCLDSYGISRLSGSVWTMAGSPCTTCKCKNGSVCCLVDVECLHNN